MMRATHKGSRSTKGWAKHAPKLRSERQALKKRCGAKAFLDPKKLGFPVVAKSGGCKLDCQGILTAMRRAKQFHHPKIAKKAARIGTKAKCHWV